MALNNCKRMPETNFNKEWGDELYSRGTQVLFIEPEEGWVVSREEFKLGSDGADNGGTAGSNEFNLE